MSFSITVDSRKVSFLEEDKTILNALEKENIDVHFHCRDGFCGACRVTLLSGKISYPKGEPLAYIGDAEILPCCCVPISDINIIY